MATNHNANGATSTPLMPPPAHLTTATVSKKRKAAGRELTQRRTTEGATTQKEKKHSTKRQKTSHQDAENASVKARKKITPKASKTTAREDVDTTMTDAPAPRVYNIASKLHPSAGRKRVKTSVTNNSNTSTHTQLNVVGSNAATTSTSTHNAEIPTNPNLVAPGAVFSPVPPPQMSPWPYDFAAPTPTYDQKIPCPIDWTAIADPRCTVDAIRAYELREPWNKSAVSFKSVANAISLSEEGARKRFKKANLAVFEATGVYFKENSLGLSKHGIPDRAELEEIIAGTTRHEKETSQNEADLKRAATTKLLSYKGTPVTVAIHPLGQKGGILRLVTEEVMSQLRISDREIIRCSPAAFDRWYSCLAMGLRHTFPKRVYRLEPFLKDYTHTDFGTPPTTISDYFETYWLSQRMGTPAVSDMILDELIQTLRDEEELLAKYRSGELTMQDNVDVVRFMNFEPHDVNLLWNKTKADDPIRELVLDILWYKGQAADEKVEEEEEDFDPAFLAAWIGRKANPVDFIKDFVERTNLDYFCGYYHNHGEDEHCYRSTPASSSVDHEEVNSFPTKAPSHLEYHTPNLTPPDAEFQGDREEDAYETPWAAVKRDDIPEGAHKIREDKDTGDIIFEIEDEHWYPPADWELDEQQQPNQPYQEFQEYRWWLWVEMGGRIPRITVKRFRPYERSFAGWRDPLQDAHRQR
ncbi:uncharacterized protein K460DRAFT_408715 [Cucurbitaria berberidis CBS 394.84]|uniref:Uncharacterized protein n=1 Tax=Cucurbitaria berberidis CBS 394.84 TaxID=1168544 RepID=A0A9P4L719_9PLEO|nr:uncharacterized protein K460DRAFT_408715 [Cucurbitaria berberidis CBS 394.84]KAF1844430.1 hypothetical protein K460DRAFT_408715 [Cucurbitaria berberidis CBS 394.84]